MQPRQIHDPIQHKLDFTIIDRSGTGSNASASDKLSEIDIRVNPNNQSEKFDSRRITGKKPLIDEKANLDELENIPAFHRKNVVIDQKEKTEGNISKYSLSTDEENNVRLRQNNSFLFDNVD